MRVVIPLPDHPYYLWQALVQAVELKRLGIPATYLVYTQTPEPSPRLRSMMNAELADWHVWTDWRLDKNYNAAMKPGLLGKWLTAHPEQAGTPFVLIDPDAIPTRVMNVPVTDNMWFGTDTDSYTGPLYLKSKPGMWEALCQLVGIDESRDDWTGVGAQMAVVGQSGEFWETVAEKSVQAHTMMDASETDIQAWCAEMYVTSMECVRRGIQLKPSRDMSMLWANGAVSDWDANGYFHNAGVSAENGRDLCKITYQESPWRQPIQVHPDSASSRYLELIQAVERQHPDLIW